MKKLILPLALLLAGCSTTQLGRAARNGDTAAVKKLLAAGDDPNSKKYTGETPLMLAAFGGHLETIEALLAAGADVNARWHSGTPLSYAATRGNEKAALLLVEHGAKVEPDAVDAAESNGFPGLARALKQRQAAAQGAGSVSVETPKYVAAVPRPNDYSVVVAVENPLDGESLATHLKSLGFPDDHVALVLGRKATRAQIAAYVEEWLPARAKADSRALFYFSGRIVDGRLLAFDTDPAFPQSTAYPLDKVFEALAKTRGFAVLDAAADAKPAAGTIVLSAAPATQTAGALPAQGHGLFTYYFLQGLSEGKRSAQELFDYAKPRVEEQARKQGRAQTPTWQGADAPL